MYRRTLSALVLPLTLLAACGDSTPLESTKGASDATQSAGRGEEEDTSIARDQAELERLTESLLTELGLSAEHVTITYLGKGTLEKGGEDNDGDILGERDLEKGDSEPLSEMVAFNPNTLNEFSISISEKALDASGRLATERGDDLGSADRSEYADPEDVEYSVESGDEKRYSWSDNVDNRVRLSKTTAEVPGTTGTTTWPWRTVSRLTNGCTGTLVGPRHVLTAGHCIWNRSNMSWLTFSVVPGGAGSLQPYGAVAFPSAGFNWYFTPSQWRATNPSGGSRQWDFGIVVLPERIGEDTGWMGWWYAGESYLDSKTHWNRGYPSCNAFDSNGNARTDDPGDAGSSVVCVSSHLYGDQNDCELGDFDKDDGQGYQRIFMHSCDASGGHSGSAIYHYHKGIPVVTGIHTFSTCGQIASSTDCTSSDDRPLGATHITKEYSDTIAFFREWAP